ncbi:MAG: pseudouridine synthase [Bacteroidota bacterium]
MKDRNSGKRPRLRQSRARNAGPSPGLRRDPAEIIGMRLNKYISHSGICSRRQAAEYVKDGLVKVNGRLEQNPAYQIQEGDVVTFRGKKVEPEADFVYVLLNKPRGVITTMSDERNRRTVMDILGDAVPQRIFPVGRLDRDTTGLLLLTNDGDLAKKLMHPSHEVPKVYVATLDKPLSNADLQQIEKGLTLEDGPVSVDWINFSDEKNRNQVSLEIHQGRNRIVRRIFEHVGYEVVKLDRTYLAGLNKKDLPRGYFRYLNEKEIIMLKHFVK